MNSIIRHIEYLISRKDCVIIPGLGAILARHRCASYDSDSHIFMPPHREFTFNPDLRHNDGTLSCSIARAEDISYESATTKLMASVEDMRRQLKRDGNLSLGRIGSLSFDRITDTILFTANHDGFCPLTSWLQAVRPTIEEKEIAGAGPVSPIRPQQFSPWARFGRIAAAITIMLGICFVASTPISIEDAALASLSPEIKHTAPEDFLPADIEPIPYIEIISVRNPEATIDVASAPQGIYCTTRQLSQAGYNFCVIVGSLRSAEDAKLFISQRPTKHLRYFCSDNKYRVFSSTYATESEAYRDINTVDYGPTGAWVYKID